MKILIDMNLSPRWCAIFERNGIDVIHWFSIGKGNETDEELFNYARQNGYVIFTHDLDFGILLAQSSEKGPSVIQVRTNDTFPEHLGRLIIETIGKYENEIGKGAIITIDKRRSRIRILPVKE